VAGDPLEVADRMDDGDLALGLVFHAVGVEQFLVAEVRQNGRQRQHARPGRPGGQSR